VRFDAAGFRELPAAKGELGHGEQRVGAALRRAAVITGDRPHARVQRGHEQFHPGLGAG
jgi:hypothetical protein